MRLLRRNVSLMQIAGYVGAALIGLTVMAVGLRFRSDTGAGHPAGSYLVVQKPLSGSLFGQSGSERFTQAEINEIASQPWARRTGEFATADFDVYARVSGGGRAMSSALFLEAVPDSFMDVSPSDWRFAPESSQTVPIVLPREYLSLYNYGFAPARGLPQVSETMASMIPIELSLSGRGRQQVLRGRIVGFSSRINTIAVPESFIRWANSVYGSSGTAGATRLIVETVTPGSPEAARWIADHGYETITDSAAQRLGSAAEAGSVVLLITGGLIVVLALVILTLSIHLLLFRNRPVLHELMQLGYTPGQCAAPYACTVAAVNMAVAAAAVAAASLLRPLWATPLAAAGIDGGSAWSCVAVTGCAALLLTAANLLTIRRMTRRAFRQL